MSPDCDPAAADFLRRGFRRRLCALRFRSLRSFPSGRKRQSECKRRLHASAQQSSPGCRCVTQRAAQGEWRARPVSSACCLSEACVRAVRWPPDTRLVTASSSPHRLGHMTRLSQRQPVRSARCQAHVVVSLCAACDGPCLGPGKEQGHPSGPGGRVDPGQPRGRSHAAPGATRGYHSASQPCWDVSPFLKLALRSLPVWAFYETVTAGLTLSIRRHSACADVVPGVRELQ